MTRWAKKTRHECQVSKVLSAMFLASRLDIFSHAAFCKRLQLGLDGNGCGWIFQLTTIKQQIRLTSSLCRESTGNIAAKGGEHWSTFCTRNTECKFLHASDSSSKRVGSFHDNGPGRLEISASCTSTYGCHAARNSLHHVLLDVTVQLCEGHRQIKNRVQRSCLVNCTHHARRRCLGTSAETSCHLE